ncbi:MAG: hypothetical protein GXX85_07600 [Ignavibacteria bacterium]|nr:hypothetical protein [Ignavibacteria bacterium]
MSLKTKNVFKKVGKIAAIAIFAVALFLNIQISSMNSSDVSNGNLSLMGVDVSLFEATYGEYSQGDCNAIGCTDGSYNCMYLVGFRMCYKGLY